MINGIYLRENKKKMKQLSHVPLEKLKKSVVILKEKIIDTYHTYEQDNIQFLKKTSWFKMFLYKNEKLIPQLSEGISKVKWIKIDNIDFYLNNSFNTISDVLKS